VLQDLPVGVAGQRRDRLVFDAEEEVKHEAASLLYI